MTYAVIVGTKVSYHVDVEAELFNQAAEKALDDVKNMNVEGGIADVTRRLAPCNMINEINSTVEIICSNGA